MDLIEAKIAEIKNLELIYIYSVDSVLKENSKEYIGVKVVYNKDNVFTLDYKNEHFAKLIKKLLERYNKEKGKKNIVLLGNLTKQLVNDSFFSIIEENKEFIQPSGILVNRKKAEVEMYQKYLKKALKIIFKAIKNYDQVNIDSMDGFNHKYIVSYSIGNVKKQLYMLIFVKEDGNIDFRITNVENEIVNISGTIEDYMNYVKINWCDSIKQLEGTVTYDSKEQTIEEKLYKDSEPIIVRETTDTLLEEDENIISFYLKLCNLDMLKNVIKIDDNCYFLSDFNVLNKNEENESILYNNTSYKIIVFDDKVIIKSKSKDGISKYGNQINAVLCDTTIEFILKKLNIDDKFYILIEKRTKKNGFINYNYSFLKLREDIILSNPFNVEDKYQIDEELKSVDMAKQYIKNIKGGK